jgi:hypothetical protein
MLETLQFALPLIAPQQAQKHVTVNEALGRLDALAQIVLVSRSQTTPPLTQPEGQAWALPGAAVNQWAGQGGKIALFLNGGWIFVTPRRGWRAFVADEGVELFHDGVQWRGGALAVSASGAGTFIKLREFDHTIGAGALSVTASGIAANELVIAVTARVITEITGTLTSWRLGTDGAEDRFGSGLGLDYGSFARGLLGTPMTYYAPAPLELRAEGGVFAGGQVRLVVHALDVGLPGV